MVEQLRSPEELNVELNKWDKAKMAALLITSLGIGALSAENATLSNIDWYWKAAAMVGTGILTLRTFFTAMDFSRKGSNLVMEAESRNLKVSGIDFRRISAPTPEDLAA